jgi:O-antigen ligase
MFRPGPFLQRHVPAALPAVLVWLAAWPLGSAHPLYRLALEAGLALFAAAVFLALPARPAPRDGQTLALRLAGLALAAWIVAQALPLPGAWAQAHGRPWLSVEPGAGLLHALGWLVLLLHATAVARIGARGKNLERAIAAFALVGVAQALLAMLRQANPESEANFFPTDRFRGSFSSPNALAGFLLLTLSANLAIFLRRWPELEEELQRARQRGRHIHSRWMPRAARLLAPTAGLLTQATALAMTGSRGAFAAALGTGLLLAVRFLRPAAKGLAASRAALLAGGALLVTLLAAGGGLWIARDRVAGALGEESDPFALRRELWTATWAGLQDEPWGVGPGRFPDAYAARLPGGPAGQRAYHAHSDPLQFLAELGVPGALALALALAAFGLRQARAWRRDDPTEAEAWPRRALAAGLLATLIHSAVDFNLSARPGVLVAAFTVVGLLEAARRRAADRNPPLRRAPGLGALAALLAPLFALHAAGEWQATRAWAALPGAPDPYLTHRPTAASDWRAAYAAAERWSPWRAAPLRQWIEAELFLSPGREEQVDAWRQFRHLGFALPAAQAAAETVLQGTRRAWAERIRPAWDRLRSRSRIDAVEVPLAAWLALLETGRVPPEADLPPAARDATTALRLLEARLLSADTPTAQLAALGPPFLLRYPARAAEWLALLPAGLTLEEAFLAAPPSGFPPEVYLAFSDFPERWSGPAALARFHRDWEQALVSTPLPPRRREAHRLRLDQERFRHAVAAGNWARAAEVQAAHRLARRSSTLREGPPNRSSRIRQEWLFERDLLPDADQRKLLAALPEDAATAARRAELTASLAPLPAFTPPEDAHPTGLVFGPDTVHWHAYALRPRGTGGGWTFTGWFSLRRHPPATIDLHVVALQFGDLEVGRGSARLRGASALAGEIGDVPLNTLREISVDLPLQNPPTHLGLRLSGREGAVPLPATPGPERLVWPWP